jgi:hypothetical protein
MSDIIYTPPVSGGGGGTTINPTNNFIPVRSNATTFIDSVLENGSDYLKSIYSTNDIGLKLDFANNLYQLGDYNGSNASILVLETYIGGIYQGDDLGIGLDFGNNLYKLGDFSSVSSGTSFLIDVASSTMYTKHSGQQEGLFFDFVNDYFQIGDFGSTNNGTFLTIDDDNQFIASYSNGNLKGLKLSFSADQYSLGDFNALSNGNYIIVDNTGVNEVVICANNKLNIKGANIQQNALYTYSLENLEIQAPDGNKYYIPLYN